MQIEVTNYTYAPTALPEHIYPDPVQVSEELPPEQQTPVDPNVGNRVDILA